MYWVHQREVAPFWGYRYSSIQPDAAGPNAMNEITPKIHQFIKDKLGVEESAIVATASFYDDLDVDSLDFCELIVDIEKAFDITIPDDEYHKLRTVEAFERYVSKLVNAKNSGVSQHEEEDEEEEEFEGRLSA